MRQELATNVKATDPDGHFEAVGDPATGVTYVKFPPAYTLPALSGAATAPLTLVDTTIVLTGLNNTASLACDGRTKFQMLVKLGTAATPPTVQLQGSQDNVTWYSMGSALAGVASSTQTKEVTDVLPQYVRATVSIIGVTIGAGWAITLRAI